MGLFEKLRAEQIDIIEWVDDTRSTLVWRFPRYHNQIKYGAQLIVRPGQVAVFVREGEIADVFEPGQYRLDTRNLPVLSTLAGWKHGFDSPFKSEVYFASTRQLTELKWGTPNPIPMRDPDFGPIRVRAFGSFAVRALDPKALLRELVGTDGVVESEEIGILLRSIIQSAFADLIASTDLSVVDLASNYRELSERLRCMVAERVDDEYGLDVPQLFIVNVSVPEEVEQALDTRSSMRVIDDLAQYQQYQLARSLPTAAANPAGGLAGAGLGMGMGMAVAGQMMPAAPPANPTPPPLPTWHVAQGGQSSGPFAFEQLAQLAAAGTLGAETLVWTAGMPQWSRAGDVPQLAPLLRV